METRKITDTLNCLQRDVGDLFTASKSLVVNAVNRSPVGCIARKVNEIVTNYPNLFFGITMVVNAFIAPYTFTAGLAAGSTVAIAHRVGLTNLSIRIVDNDEDKVDFTYLSPFATILLSPWISSLGHGFILGNYLCRRGMKEATDWTRNELHNRIDQTFGCRRNSMTNTEVSN